LDELAEAEKLLKQTREEANDANLPVLEAEATAALAQVYLAQKDAEAACRTARLAIRLAEEFDGRPLLCEAYATLAEASHELGRSDEALTGHVKGKETLSWIVDNLNQEHVESFLHRPDVQVLLKEKPSDSGRK
jgi:ATP/maltotriose-dependent transcriptional regulator MalT